MFPLVFSPPAWPRSLCCGRVGEDSDDEFGHSSESTSKICSPSKYLHSPLQISKERIAVRKNRIGEFQSKKIKEKKFTLSSYPRGW